MIWSNEVHACSFFCRSEQTSELKLQSGSGWDMTPKEQRLPDAVAMLEGGTAVHGVR